MAWLTTPTLRPRITSSVGALSLYSGDGIHKHTADGPETALGASEIAILVYKPRGVPNPK